MTAVVIAAAVYAATFLWAGPVTTLFNSEGNTQLQQIAEDGLLAVFYRAVPLRGSTSSCRCILPPSNTPVPGQIIALLRGFAIILPMAFALAAAFGLDGVWCAFPVTEAIVTVVGAVLYRRARHLPPPLPETLP